jgi:hypothetical protein
MIRRRTTRCCQAIGAASLQFSRSSRGYRVARIGGGGGGSTGFAVTLPSERCTYEVADAGFPARRFGRRPERRVANRAACRGPPIGCGHISRFVAGGDQSPCPALRGLATGRGGGGWLFRLEPHKGGQRAHMGVAGRGAPGAGPRVPFGSWTAGLGKPPAFDAFFYVAFLCSQTVIFATPSLHRPGTGVPLLSVAPASIASRSPPAPRSRTQTTGTGTCSKFQRSCGAGCQPDDLSASKWFNLG